MGWAWACMGEERGVFVFDCILIIFYNKWIRVFPCRRTYGRTDGRRDRYDGTLSRFSKFCDSPKTLGNILSVNTWPSNVPLLSLLLERFLHAGCTQSLVSHVSRFRISLGYIAKRSFGSCDSVFDSGNHLINVEISCFLVSSRKGRNIVYTIRVSWRANLLDI